MEGASNRAALLGTQGRAKLNPSPRQLHRCIAIETRLMEPKTLPRTLVLTERTTAQCRLNPAEVEILVTSHRAHLTLIPSCRRGHYRLTPTGHVGTIVTPSCRLVIRPKIPIDNLFHLLDPTAPAPVSDDQAATKIGSAALDFLALQLARLLAERAGAGLHRAYTERASIAAFVQGRLDLPEQLRGVGGRKDRIHCRYDDFTTDIPCNQVPKATAKLVLASRLLGDAARAALHRSLGAYGNVGPIVLTQAAFSAAEPDRLTESYRRLVDVCRLLAEGLSPAEAAGSASCPAFLLNMERVFERYVTRGVQAAAAASGRYSVSVQPAVTANRPVAGQPNIPMRPDLRIDEAGRAVVILDVKWKRAGQPPLVPADLYQVMAYATALGAPRAVLVYPGRRDRVWSYPVAGAPLVVDIRSLRVVGGRSACVRSLDRLGRAVRPQS
jgi:5-methylcytosine-specific restriction enzyme subunit McrC